MEQPVGGSHPVDSAYRRARNRSNDGSHALPELGDRMDSQTGQEQQALLAQLAQAQEKLDRLAGDLRAIDAELEDLSTERHQYRLLHDACGALEELRQIGAAELFWGDRAAA